MPSSKTNLISTDYTVSGLSTREIESDLRNFLKYQHEFTDYDFEGSGLSVLVRLLGYNTLYNNVYDNFALNESFLDSAIKRESVISHANTLNYTPRSAQASTAVVNFTVIDNGVYLKDTLYLPVHSPFTTSVDGKQYTFYTTQSATARRDGNQYLFENLEIKEGTFVTTRQVYGGSYYETFGIKNNNADLSTLEVNVFGDRETSENETYWRADDLLDIDGESTCYFLKNNVDGTYEVQFGNGAIGKALSVGNVVQLSYITCHEDEPDGATVFKYSGEYTNATMQSIVSCVVAAHGGASAEATEEIRYNAPHYYTTQNRLVTAGDYKAYIKAKFENCRAINAWGGEDCDPPEYGRVHLSIIPKKGYTLTDSEKYFILNRLLKDKKTLTTGVVIEDADYIRIGLNLTVYYNPSLTAYGDSDIETLARVAVLNYNENFLGGFNSLFRMSNLQTAVDGVDRAVTNNSARIFLYKTLTPQYGENVEYELRFCNPIFKSASANESVLSSGFYCSFAENVVCYIDDDPLTERMRLFWRDENNSKVLISEDIGTIDYATGLIKIRDLNITAIEGGELTFAADPASTDVQSSRNSFVTIDPTLLTINSVALRTDADFVQSLNK